MIEPYKGVRDFYPEDQRIQTHIFDAMRRAVELYGYEEYNASILESTELYTAKTSEEIVNEQTYTFTDRGDRSVTLRPEMTPTVARMVAARKRELGFPLRWYSIQNFFRYERPQRGRLREFWQLNADLFGVSGIEADAEIIAVAYRVMKELKATDTDFSIRICDRQFLNGLYDQYGIDEERRKEVTRLLDKREKIQNFSDELEQLVGEKAEEFLKGLSSPSYPYFDELLALLSKKGISNVVVDTSITRGFDYYTGMVFEVFDTNPENARSMFGGGRYDNLVGQYGSEDVPAVGFAMGDVIARDFLETHGLLPEASAKTSLYLAPASDTDIELASHFAETLRVNGVRVALGLKHGKIGDHIKTALKLGIPHFAVYGPEEESSGTILLKELKTEKETSISRDDLASHLLTEG